MATANLFIESQQTILEHVAKAQTSMGSATGVADHPIDEALLRRLLESTPDALLAVREDGRILVASSHTESMFGYGAGELTGRPLDILLPESARHTSGRNGVTCRGLRQIGRGTARCRRNRTS